MLVQGLCKRGFLGGLVNCLPVPKQTFYTTHYIVGINYHRSLPNLTFRYIPAIKKGLDASTAQVAGGIE